MERVMETELELENDTVGVLELVSEDVRLSDLELDCDRVGVIFTPTGGSWKLMTRYQVNVIQEETIDEIGNPFANGVSNVFYTTPAGALAPVAAAGAVAAAPVMDASIWRWLGPVLGVIILALLALLLALCLKYCRRRPKNALAQTSSKISSTASSSSTRVLDESASLQASRSFVVGTADSVHGDSSPYLRSSYSENRRPPPDFAIFGQHKPQSQLDSDAAEGSVAAMATLRAWEAAKGAPTHRGEGVEWEDVYDASGMHNAEGVVVDVEGRRHEDHSESMFGYSGGDASRTGGKSFVSRTTSDDRRSKNSSST